MSTQADPEMSSISILELLEQTLLITLVFSFLISFFIYKWYFTTSSTRNIPPSTPKLPIIGNLHQLGTLPHRHLRSMSQKYGDMMMVHLGSRPVLVISSADAAREIMRTHDLIFSDRSQSDFAKKLLYNAKDIAAAPYGEYWRQIKSICVLQLLSNTRVRSFHHVREEETGLMIEKIRGLGLLPVNLSEMFMKFSNDVTCRVAFGRKYSGEEVGGLNFSELLKGFSELLGAFNVRDFIPWLGWINRLNGLDAKADRVAKGFDQFLEGVVRQHLEDLNKEDDHGQSAKDFVHILLEIQREQNTHPDSIKGIILDMFAGGTDTTSTVLEWAMSELLRHPQAMKQLQDEVRGVTQGIIGIISDDDLKRIKYLKAVIKETIRLHPPLPLLVPRKSTQDAKINGFVIPAGTQVIINAWTIHRDPTSWEQPEEFKPERFLDSSIEFKGQDFQLIPFGAGRRGCPGISFAITNVELVLANLVNDFNWELPVEEKRGGLDMMECDGITTRRSRPLLAVATPYY